MAFIAHRDHMGKVVDRQDLSGGRFPNCNETSDEDSIAGSNRSSAPTVRFLGHKTVSGKELDEISLSQTLVADQEDAEDVDEFLDGDGDSDSDSITNFCQELEEEETRERLAGLALNVEDVEALLNPYKDSPRPNDQQEDSQSMSSCNSGTLGPDEPADYFCELLKPTIIPGKPPNKPQPHGGDADSASLSSFNSCVAESESERSYIGCNATEQDMRLLEASAGRELMTSRTYNLETSSQSTCSWNHAYGAAFEAAEGHRNYLPSLSLASRNSDCSTYYKSLEDTKERDGLKFEKWKQLKEDQRHKKLLAAKREAERRAREIAERAAKAKKKYDEWCQRKEQQKQREKKKPLPPPIQNQNQIQKPKRESLRSLSLRTETPEEAKARIQEWERRKVEQQQRERDRLRRERQQREEDEKKRIELAEAAYTKWMQTIELRPMPVPLNQGFATLRGTVSDIFINPNKWDSNIDSKHDDRCI